MAKLTRRRRRLWDRDPRCCFCVRLTLLPEEASRLYEAAPHGLFRRLSRRVQEMLATLDHINNRFDPQRTSPNLTNEERTRLLCWRCNTRRGSEDYNHLPLSERRRRSGHFCPICQATEIQSNIFPIEDGAWRIQKVCGACGIRFMEKTVGARLAFQRAY